MLFLVKKENDLLCKMTKERHRGSLWRCTDGSDWSRILPRFSDLRQVIQKKCIYKPDLERHELYKPFRKLFDELYRCNQEILHSLSKHNK